MARTKQTARKSSGGKASRKQLATSSVRSFKSFMCNEQSSGKKGKKTVFINCENTFRNFNFKRRHNLTSDFEPVIQLGRVKKTLSNKEGVQDNDLYMRFDIASRLDGQGIYCSIFI